MILTWKNHEGPGGATIPIAEIDGGEPGPAWLFTAGVHGDEYEGPEAIRRAAFHLARTPFAGRVIAAPVVNPMAYSRGVRCAPEDGVNLNRAFPGRADGSLTYRWAHWFWTTFVERSDRLVDLHAGGAMFEFETLAGFYEIEDAPLAAAFGLTLWHAPDTPGVFSREFRKRRGRSIGAELGFGGTRNEAAAQAAAAALVNLATTPPGPVSGPIYGHNDVLAAVEGEWNARVKVTQQVRRGQTLGIIMDWRGQPVETVVSPCDGRVLALRRLISTPANDLVAVVGPQEK